MNIPIYRAKMINSDGYVVGNYIKTQNKYYIYEDGTSDIYLDDEECFNDGSIDGEIRIIDLIFEIDPTTLSVHFPDMLDSQGNKIFASLSEDGKGGDICYVRDFYYGDLQGVARYEDNHFRIHRKGKAMGISLKCRDIKVIGIQE